MGVCFIFFFSCWSYLGCLGCCDLNFRGSGYCFYCIYGSRFSFNIVVLYLIWFLLCCMCFFLGFIYYSCFCLFYFGFLLFWPSSYLYLCGDIFLGVSLFGVALCVVC